MRHWQMRAHADVRMLQPGLEVVVQVTRASSSRVLSAGPRASVSGPSGGRVAPFLVAPPMGTPFGTFCVRRPDTDIRILGMERGRCPGGTGLDT